MRAGWIATAAVLALLLALVGNLATNTVQVPDGWAWVPWLAVGLVGLLTVALTVRQHRMQDRRPLVTFDLGAVLTDPLPGRALYTVDGRLPKVSEVELLHLRVKPAIDTTRDDGRGLPPYVHRDIDDDLEWAITTGGMVLLHGRAASGKTRTAAEALRRLRPHHNIVIPASGSALRELIESGYDLGDAVIWLDDLEQFLVPGGLDLALLQRLCPLGSRTVAIVATIRDNELAVYDRAAVTREAPVGIERGAIDLVAQINGRRRLAVAQHLSPTERDNADSCRRSDIRIRRAMRADEGFAEYLAAGTALMDYWSTGDGALFQVGQAIVSAAVDCRRAGYHQPLAGTVLTELHQQYIPSGWRQRRDLPDPSDGIVWASTILLGASSCLQPREGHTFLASDYLLDRAQNGASPLRNMPIPESVWETVLTLSAGTDFFALLEGRQKFQATHDLLTGLSNRRRFVERIRELLHDKSVGGNITLFHIDLDGFAAVNNGGGWHVGDKLLQVVARRLVSAVQDQTATVARLDADEFGIVVVNSSDSPSAAAIAERINDELGEPVYIEGRGVAATACIAVLERPPTDTDATDLLQAMDMTLRRLKASGRRQWALVDRELEARDRERFHLASSIPGAWESGEIELEYQRLVAIDDRRIVAVQPLLRWDHPERGTLEHDRCIEALEETGLSLPIGRWMLSKACEEMTSSKGAAQPLLYVELTRQQAADPDLVSTVQAALVDIEMRSDQLWLGMPVQALCMVDGLAEDNLDILVDLGISGVLCEFGTTRGDLACLEDLPVSYIKMAPRVTTRVMRGVERQSVFVKAIAGLMPLIRETGAAVIAGPIASEEQLAWWQKSGADIVLGTLFGTPGPLEDVERPFVA